MPIRTVFVTPVTYVAKDKIKNRITDDYSDEGEVQTISGS